MAKISFILACRIENGREALLERYLESLLKNCDNTRNIEVVIKFDDDQEISHAQQVIEKYQPHFTIKYIVTPRGQGYQHLAYFYTELFFQTDVKSQLFAVHSIDLVATKKGFDAILLEESKKFEDGIFVMHSISMLSFSRDIKSVNDAVQRPDNFPIWSRKWIEIQGHFGYNSSTDGWTQLTEFLLFTEHGIDRRINITIHEMFKEMDNVDRGINSQYWAIKRREAMEHHLSEHNIELARQNANNIALNIYCHDLLTRNRNLEGASLSYHKHLINAVLDSYDSAMRTAEKEMECLRNQISEYKIAQQSTTVIPQTIQCQVANSSNDDKKTELLIRRFRAVSGIAIALALLSLITQFLS